MIYWHVDAKAVCIYSQLKRCSSSEVASMIEGVLHHCTDMEVEQQYVDSHGQSIVAFAFCHLLGFSLMPRFKGIDKLKLAQPESGARERYPNLASIFNAALLAALNSQSSLALASVLRIGCFSSLSLSRSTM